MTDAEKLAAALDEIERLQRQCDDFAMHGASRTAELQAEVYRLQSALDEATVVRNRWEADWHEKALAYSTVYNELEPLKIALAEMTKARNTACDDLEFLLWEYGPKYVNRLQIGALRAVGGGGESAPANKCPCCNGNACGDPMCRCCGG